MFFKCIHLFKETSFCFIDFSIIFYFIDIYPYHFFSFLLFALDLFCSSFSRFLIWKLRLLIWEISYFLMSLGAMNFPLVAALFVFHKFCHFVYLFYSSVYFLKYSLRLPLWSREYLKVCCLVSKYLEIVPLSFSWFLVWFYCGWGTHTDFNSF